MSHKNSMVIANSLYNITLNILCLQTNQRSSETAAATILFWRLLRVTHFLTTVVSDWRDWTRLSDWTGILFFWSAVLLSTFILVFSPSCSVSLSYCNLAVPMPRFFGKHSCMSSTFSIVILNGTCSLRAPILFYFINDNEILKAHW